MHACTVRFLFYLFVGFYHILRIFYNSIILIIITLEFNHIHILIRINHNEGFCYVVAF
jgi:hypothetical protein